VILDKCPDAPRTLGLPVVYVCITEVLLTQAREAYEYHGGAMILSMQFVEAELLEALATLFESTRSRPRGNRQV
jgi:hypothetical protein